MKTRQAGVTRDGYDRIGPFHPFVVWGAVVLFDLTVIALILLAVTMAGDRVEDRMFPGGEEWVTI